MDQSRREIRSVAAGAAPRRPLTPLARKTAGRLAPAPVKNDASDSRAGRASSLALEAERSRKINRIRRAVAAGQYRVSASDIAGKLMEHMLKK